jgi:hypothetical protein
MASLRAQIVSNIGKLILGKADGALFGSHTAHVWFETSRINIGLGTKISLHTPVAKHPPSLNSVNYQR